ncbi:MAG: adenosylhomocysteinase [Candidatus Dormiibacterota bacterium]
MAAAASDVFDHGLAALGEELIDWAAREMPVLASIRDRFRRDRPLAGLRIGGSLHVTSETANLVLTLAAGGAEVALCASNPLSTNDAVAAALVDARVRTFAVRGEDAQTYQKHLHAVLDWRPQLTLDDGADLVGTLHADRRELLPEVLGGTEETTTGVLRIRAMARQGVLRFPLIDVNEADTKHLFDNRYGTGQSTIDGILRATNVLLAGKVFVVAGYGWCGRGLASRVRGLGAQVVVTEVDPVRALEAAMDGFRVLPMARAAEVGDLFVTVTGDVDVLDGSHFAVMKDGAILANAGHFDDEINLPALEGAAVDVQEVRPNVRQYRLADGRRLHLLAEGRLVNLAAAEGHPAAVMDMSFANQALCIEYLAAHAASLEARVYDVPPEIDGEVARLKLAAMGVAIDQLTEAQERYLDSWEQGT